MRKIFIAFLLFFSYFAHSQNNIYRSGGISQTIGPPTFIPGTGGNVVAIDTLTGEWYVNPNRLSGGSWISAGYRLTNISGAVSPAYTPTKFQSRLVINAVDSIYYYNGSSWKHVNKIPAVSITNGGGIAVTGTYPNFTLTATDQSATNELQTIDTFSLSGQTLSASLSSDAQPAKTVTLPVTNVTAGTGISVSSATGNYTVTNSAPDQTVSIANGGGITPSGTYPNFTLTATDQSTTNEIQQIDTFSVSGSVLSLSLQNDGVPAKTVTLPGGGGGGGISGITQYIPKFNSSTTVDTSGLYWSTDGMLGIRTTTPSAILDIKGTAATDSTVRIGPELLTTGTGAGWSGTSFSTGYTHTTGTTALTANSLTITAGTYYKVTVTVTGRSAGTCTATVGGLTSGAINTNTTVTYEGFASTTANFSVATASTFNGTVTASMKVMYMMSPVISIENADGSINNEIRTTKSNTNLVIGKNAGGYLGYNTTSGINNTALGNLALGRNFATNEAVAIGGSALRSGGNRGVAIGYGSSSSTTGQNNVTIGYNSAANIGNSGSCVIIGAGATGISANNNQIAIGSSATGLGTNTTYIGNSSITRTVLAGSLVMGSTTATPSARTHTIGSGNVAGTYSLWATNSTNSATEPGLCVGDDLKVGIGTNSIDAGAALEVDGTTGGILFPRLTTTERDALTPTNGLMIYNTTTSKFQGYAGGAWVDLH